MIRKALLAAMLLQVVLVLLGLGLWAKAAQGQLSPLTLKVRLSAIYEEGAATYSLILENDNSTDIGDLYIAAAVPADAAFAGALITPPGSWFRGVEGGAAVWLSRRVPARGVQGPFAYRVRTTGPSLGPSHAWVRWATPAEGSIRSQDVAPGEGVRMVFWGNMTFQFTSPNGKIIITNPWIEGNRDAPLALQDIAQADLLLVGSGHRDDGGWDTIDIAQRTGAKVLAAGELIGWMAEHGLPSQQGVAMGPSGYWDFDGLRIRAVGAIHGSGATAAPGQPPAYGGVAMGFIITFENGLRVYFASDTGLTMDMQLYGMRYKPEVAILPIAGRFMMHPDDAAFAAKLLMTDNPYLRTVVPAHHRLATPSPGGGTPEAFAAEVRNLGLPLVVLDPKPGQVYTLSK